MSQPTIESLVREYIAKEIAAGADAPPLDDETKLIESGILDSLSILKLVIFIEEQFGLKVAPDDVVPDNFQTIPAIGSYIRTKKS